MSDTVANSDTEYRNAYDDPLFLSMSDYSGMKLLETVFNGHNYPNWSRGMLLALGSKNKQGFVNGAIPKPDANSPKLQQWIRCDAMVRCWLSNTIAVGIKEAFTSSKSARLMWLDIQERYGQSNGPLLFQLKKEIKNILQDHDSIAEYFTKLKRRWDDIDEIEPFPECQCGVLEKCTCNILKKMLEASSKEKLITFLMGLDHTYEHLRTNILSMEPLPNINRAYSIMHQVESQKNITNILQTAEDTSALNAARPGPNKNGGPNVAWNVWKRDGSSNTKKPKFDDRWCSACNKGGHTPATCFNLHPELRASYQARKKNNSKPGYTNNFTPRVAANAETYEDETPLDFTNVSSTSKGPEQVNPALVSAVYQQIMQALQAKGQGGSQDYTSASVNFAGIILATNVVSDARLPDEVSWILDSKSYDHMTAYRSLFVSFRNLPKPILIGLPDGTTKLVRHCGDIKISSSITLHDVLYVPDFKYNLLSIGKLLLHSHMRVFFDMDYCIIQDQDNKLVATCTKEGGLYKLKQASLAIKNNETRHNDNIVSTQMFCPSSSLTCTEIDRCAVHSKMELLHARLGHTSSVKMQHISDLQHIAMINKEDLKNYHCDTCILAKLHRLSFERDLTRAPSIFHLIHIDLGGHIRLLV
ncbi:uncharacterized protein LOC141630175 [Silene latifolia]|uniref:uncharacterized protein LOC141630175 n=1 Tax=Silene latifolia TaxID=37657 RepID=UPI003D788787